LLLPVLAVVLSPVALLWVVLPVLELVLIHRYWLPMLEGQAGILHV
jgi:hypothetical protein